MLYGLTLAESRVALLLSDGHAPRKIAEIVGVTDSTVRSQIKSVFSKTGVRRQGVLHLKVLTWMIVAFGRRRPRRGPTDVLRL
jgi:DNA-binding CsgD family transcriptional regulator